MTGLKIIAANPVIKGFSTEQHMRLGERKQAPILTFRIMSRLEAMVAANALPIDELIIAGAVLLIVCLRSRYSDLDDCREVVIRDETIEVRVGKTKTASTAKDRLPLWMAGPRYLVTNNDWVTCWMAARKNQLLEFPDFPPFPAYSGGVWLDTPATLAEMNAGLRVIIARADDGSNLSFSSQGLKATSLSWAQKFGIPAGEREALGYHKVRQQSSVRAYARERLEGPLKKLICMFGSIRNGTFDPDTGKFADKDAEETPPQAPASPLLTP